jgi:hypothetical protein
MLNSLNQVMPNLRLKYNLNKGYKLCVDVTTPQNKLIGQIIYFTEPAIFNKVSFYYLAYFMPEHACLWVQAPLDGVGYLESCYSLYQTRLLEDQTK